MYGRNRRSPSPGDRRGGGRGGGRYHILIKNIAFEVDWKKLKDIIKVAYYFSIITNKNFRRTKVLNQSSLKLWKIVEEVRDLVSLHFIANQICVKHVNG